MAKQIKAIKCPSCGSGEHEEYTSHKFKCSSCGTIFFIDNNNPNQFADQLFQTAAQPTNKPINKPASLKGMWIFLGVCTLIIIGCLIVSDYSSKKTKSTTQSIASQITPKKTYNDTPKGSFVYENKEGKIISCILFVRSERNNRSDSKSTLTVNFIDIESNKVLSHKEIKDVETSSFTFNLVIKTSSAGNPYIMLNKKEIYEVQKENLDVVDITKKLTEGISEFETGISTIEFVSAAKSDGLKIMNNVGDLYYYYPAQKLLLNPKEEDRLSSDFNTLMDGAKDEQLYSFLSSDIINKPTTKMYLYQFDYKTNNGGPCNAWGFSLSTAFKHKGDGVFVIQSHNQYIYKRNRMTSYKALTKDRVYFSAGVEYSNSKEVLIRYKAVIAEEAPYILQSLNSETGAINWTRELGKDQKYIRNVLKTSSNEYILTLSDKKLLRLTDQGETKKEYNLEQ